MRYLVLLSLLFASSRSTHSAATAFYIAPTGNDSNPGASDKPFATLERARDAIRALRERSDSFTGATVWIRGGTSFRDHTFELTSSDSGRSNAPITYSAIANETARFLGGRIAPNFVPVVDAGILARLDPKARGKVVQADLKPLHIANLGHLGSRGFGRPTAPAHLELFYGGQPMTLARWPNEGEWEKISGFPETAGKGDDHGGKIGDLPGGFYYSGERPERWQSKSDIWVHGYWSWDWANSYERIETLDTAKHVIKTAAPFGLYGFRKGQRFYFLNVLEELDSPGEWFLDRASQLLYFWPPSPSSGSARIAPVEALVSVLEAPLVSMDGTSHTTLRGLTLEASRGHGITIQNGTDVLITQCALRLLGNYGVRISGGRNHSVANCDIENTGDGGVDVSGGDRQTLSAGGHVVENCHFQKQGRWSKCYVPAVLVSGVGHRIAHNLIHDHPHCAILYSGNDHTIDFNEIHHVALETGDVGAIYAGRDWTFRGNRIRHNFIHHTGGVGMGSMGVYMDDCVSGTEIFGNVFYKVTRAAFLGGGRDHLVANNIFVDCDPAVQIDGRGMDKSPVWHGMVYDYMKRQLNAVPLDLYRTRYPELAAVEAQYQAGTDGIPPEGNQVVRNLCVGGKWLGVGWHAVEGMVTLRDNHVGSRAELGDPELRQFEPKPDSPIWKTGFKPIPFDQIGMQREKAEQPR